MSSYKKLNRLLLILYVVTALDFLGAFLSSYSKSEIIIDISITIFCINIALLMVLREIIKELDL